MAWIVESKIEMKQLLTFRFHLVTLEGDEFMII